MYSQVWHIRVQHQFACLTNITSFFIIDQQSLKTQLLCNILVLKVFPGSPKAVPTNIPSCARGEKHFFTCFPRPSFFVLIHTERVNKNYISLVKLVHCESNPITLSSVGKSKRTSLPATRLQETQAHLEKLVKDLCATDWTFWSFSKVTFQYFRISDAYRSSRARMARQYRRGTDGVRAKKASNWVQLWWSIETKLVISLDLDLHIIYRMEVHSPRAVKTMLALFPRWQ